MENFRYAVENALISSSSAAIEGQSSSLLNSLTSCSQSTSKRTSLFPIFSTSCISHISPSATACRGDAALTTPRAPYRVSDLVFIKTNPRPARSLLLIQDASIYHLHCVGAGVIGGGIVLCGSSCSTSSVSSTRWAKLQLSDSFH